MHDPRQWSRELEAAVAAARSAGRIQLASVGAVLEVQTKSSDVDLVTEIDRRCEDLIRDTLLGAFPADSFLGEEDGTTPGESGRRWIVDPLDGTLNYTHGFPYFAVSIALESDGELVVAVVHDATRDEVFTAVRGGGAHVDGVPIRVSDRAPLAGALLATGFAYAAREDGANLPLFVAMLERSRGIRRAGAAALDMAYTAAGRLDGFWEMALKPWDTAAGTLLIREAGGIVTDGAGAPHIPGAPSVVAAGPSLHAELLRELRGADRIGALVRG
jgi:myo-inositol-1(or 4)-monophosphatase